MDAMSMENGCAVVEAQGRDSEDYGQGGCWRAVGSQVCWVAGRHGTDSSNGAVCS